MTLKEIFIYIWLVFSVVVISLAILSQFASRMGGTCDDYKFIFKPIIEAKGNCFVEVEEGVYMDVMVYLRSPANER